MEDLFQAKYTIAALKNSFSIEITQEELGALQKQTGSKISKPGKWTDVVRRILNENGKVPDATTLDTVKEKWVDSVISKFSVNETPQLFKALNNRVTSILPRSTNKKLGSTEKQLVPVFNPNVLKEVVTNSS